MYARRFSSFRLSSHPSRGGWIEMKNDKRMIVSAAVPPLAGWVD